MRLLAGATLLNSSSTPALVTKGQFVTVTVVYDAVAGDESLGFLKIELENLSRSQTNYDDVRLTATSLDILPPDVTTALTPVGDYDDDDEGAFRVEFS